MKTVMKPRATPTRSLPAGTWETLPRGSYRPQHVPETALSRTEPWFDSWYGFCTWRYAAHIERNEPSAAMIWWSLRMIDTIPIGDPEDPCTESGYAEQAAYWDYKLPIALREQDELCH